MLTRIQLFTLNFYKKEKFTGSMGKMCFRLEKYENQISEEESETVFLATTWEGPFCYTATPDEKKERAMFPFSEEGLVMAMDHFNAKGKEMNQGL